MNSNTRIATWLREYRGTLLFLSLMFAFRSSYADWMVVPTGSMNPTIIEGDRVLVDKHVYGWHLPFVSTLLTHGADPQRGEIAVFYSPADGMRLIKRVAGVPGDVVEMKDEVLFINGVATRYTADAPHLDLLSETLQQQPQFAVEQLGDTQHSVMFLPHRMALRSFGPLRIPDDRYLMLGDNRDNSADSRFIGLVPRDRFVGKASHVVISLNPDHFYLPRTDRFGKPLT